MRASAFERVILTARFREGESLRARHSEDLGRQQESVFWAGNGAGTYASRRHSLPLGLCDGPKSDLRKALTCVCEPKIPVCVEMKKSEPSDPVVRAAFEAPVPILVANAAKSRPRAERRPLVAFASRMSWLTLRCEVISIYAVEISKLIPQGRCAPT